MRGHSGSFPPSCVRFTPGFGIEVSSGDAPDPLGAHPGQDSLSAAPPGGGDDDPPGDAPDDPEGDDPAVSETKGKAPAKRRSKTRGLGAKDNAPGRPGTRSAPKPKRHGKTAR